MTVSEITALRIAEDAATAAQGITPQQQIDLLVTRERQLMARRDYWQAALTQIIVRLGSEIDAVQTERWALQERGFRDFDHEHGMERQAA